MFLNLESDILSNQVIDENILLNENMDYIKILKGNLDLKTLDGKKLLLNQIRNAFAHKSGQINFYAEENTKKVRIDNKSWFSIEANLTNLNSLLNKIIVKDSKNNVQKMMIDTISNIQNNNFQNISDNAVIVMLLNLLMCYNKESLFDKFMLTQSSFIDASNFKINSTENWKFTESKLRQSFFDKFNILFNSNDDKNSYDNEWKSIVNIYDSTNAANYFYIYDEKKMPFDAFTKKHIPIPIFMNFLRNANSHGRIKIEDDNFVFYDQENSDSALPYIYMKINKNELLEFIFSDYFVESITTTIDDHQNKYSSNLYLLEQAQSVNNFSNYINIYKNRMPHLSETEIIKYMYKNNKFSSYLTEYPEQIDSFLEYKLNDGSKLTSKLCQFNDMPSDSFNNIKVNGKKNNKLKLLFYLSGFELYSIILSDYKTQITDSDRNIMKNKTYKFFELYYLFIRNLKTINPNINYNNIDENTKKKIESGIKELQYEFIDNDVFLENSETSKQILTEIGMQKSNFSEIDKLMVAITLGKENATRKDKEKQENRYTIKDIEKHSSLAHIYEESASNNYKLATEDKKNLAKVLVLNLGIKIINDGIIMWSNRKGITPMTAEIELLTYPTSVFICNLAIYKTLFNLNNKLRKRFNYKIRSEKYSDNYNRSDENENRIDGSHSIRK